MEGINFPPLVFNKKGDAMKKTTLLFTILCAVQLYGMEETQKMGTFGSLPEDIHKVIVQSLATSNNLEQTIEAIKVAGILQGVRYDNLKDFTKLVHILANKFNVPTEKIAKKFNTPIAQKYLQLCSDLFKKILMRSSIEELTQLIQQGADVNCSAKFVLQLGGVNTALNYTIRLGTTDALKILLDYGATPTAKDVRLAENRLPEMQKAIIEAMNK